jgi:hypothetical protein
MSESSNHQENLQPSPSPVSWEETVLRWSTTCSLCEQPCASEDAKQLALGHVMHLACYDKWLESQDDGARLKAKIQSIMAEDEIDRGVRKWMRGEQ